MIINIISKRQAVNPAKRVKRCRHHLLTISTNNLLSSYMLTGIEIQWILVSLLFSDLKSKVFINRVYLLIRARYAYSCRSLKCYFGRINGKESLL
ncbi:hypothetical protein HanRHA438_Chr03g0097881 [Helianthus annuus]|nr:hypothetical protein HanRHA438_Chr03g0097881 [Helianthus annuus]